MKTVHVLSAIIISLFLLILILSSDNPILLLGVFIFIFSVLLSQGQLSSLKKSIVYFLPFATLTILINVIIVHQGSIVLFTILNNDFTLEAFIYAFILSFKLLILIDLFLFLSSLIDSDRAVSFFSSVMPKTTLTMMISLKMFPGMKTRLTTLKEVYSLRGVDFKPKNKTSKIKSIVPLISVLLEDSLESSFDIGEACYVRGFLSGRRSIYDRQTLKGIDYILLGSTLLLALFYISIKLFNMDNFSIYTGIDFSKILSLGVVITFILLILYTLGIHYILREKSDVIYSD